MIDPSIINKISQDEFRDFSFVNSDYKRRDSLGLSAACSSETTTGSKSIAPASAAVTSSSWWSCELLRDCCCWHLPVLAVFLTRSLRVCILPTWWQIPVYRCPRPLQPKLLTVTDEHWAIYYLLRTGNIHLLLTVGSLLLFLSSSLDNWMTVIYWLLPSVP